MTAWRAAVDERGRVHVQTTTPPSVEHAAAIRSAGGRQMPKKPTHWHWPSGTWSPAVESRLLAARIPLKWSGRRVCDPVMPPNTADLTGLWPHQIEAIEAARHMPRIILDHSLGAGKTRTSLTICIGEGRRRILVIAPSTVLPGWRRNLAQFFPDATVSCPEGSSTAVRIKRFDPTAQVWLLHWGCSEKLLDHAAEWAPDALILDEAHRAKGPGSKIHHWLVANMGPIVGPDRVVEATGTPLAQHPHNLWGLSRICRPGMFAASFDGFARDYFAPDRAATIAAERNNASGYFPSRTFNPDREDRFNRARSMICHTVRGTWDGDVTVSPRWIDAAPAQRRALTDLRDDFIAFLADGQAVTAANAGARMVRARQITSGFAVPEDGPAVDIVTDDKNPKAIALRDLLTDMDTDDPVVVWCQFTRDLDAVRLVAKRAGRVYGEISGRSRTGLSDEGRLAPGVTLVGAQWDAASEGIELVESATAVVWSSTVRVVAWRQGVGRLNRPGQTRPVTVVPLLITDSPDEHIYDALGSATATIDSLDDTAAAVTAAKQWLAAP